jgi:hypothetical protein
LKGLDELLDFEGRVADFFEVFDNQTTS